MIDGPALRSDGEIDWNVKPVSKQSVAFSLGMKDNRCGKAFDGDKGL